MVAITEITKYGIWILKWYGLSNKSNSTTFIEHNEGAENWEYSGTTTAFYTLEEKLKEDEYWRKRQEKIDTKNREKELYSIERSLKRKVNINSNSKYFE